MLDCISRKLKKVTAEQINEKQVKINTVLSTSAGKEEYTYMVYGSGDISIDHKISLKGNLPPLPKIGVSLTVSGELENIDWYGRGPQETYPDRLLSGRMDIYNGKVKDQYVPYIMPQENGNKTDVRWIALSDNEGNGVMAIMDGYNASAHYLTAEDLDVARHTYEVYNNDDITLNIDYEMCGLGNGSCGPAVLDHYLIYPGKYEYNIRLRPFSSGQGPLQLSRTELP